MSTKIYTGQISTSVDVFETARNIRAVLQPWFNERVADATKHAHGRAGEKYTDVYRLPPKMQKKWDVPIPENRWDIAHDITDLVDGLKREELRTFSELDFGVNVVIMENGRKGFAPLVLVFCEDGGEELRTKLQESGAIEEYGYWDNTDRPDDLSKAEWKEREMAWETMAWGMSPSESGVRLVPSNISARMSVLF